MTKRIILLAFVTLLACGPGKPPNRPDPDPNNCKAACTHLQELKCPEGEPFVIHTGTPDSRTVTCTEFCIDVQEKGHAMDAACVAQIKTCKEIQSCNW